VQLHHSAYHLLLPARLELQPQFAPKSAQLLLDDRSQPYAPDLHGWWLTLKVLKI
jgi:hypothetical protein